MPQTIDPRRVLQSGPVRVELRAVVSSRNDVESPLTGLRAAHVRVTLAERWKRGLVEPLPDDDEGPDVVRVLGTCAFGGELWLRSGATTVLARGFVLPPAPPGGEFVVHTALPPPLAALAARALGRGSIVAREQLLLEGESVRLRGFVALDADPERGYRGADGARVVTRPDLGPVELEPADDGAGLVPLSRRLTEWFRRSFTSGD